MLVQQSSSNDKRRLIEPPPSPAARADLAARARFGPYAKHKKHPDAYGLKPYEGPHEDPTYCDDHAAFGPADMSRAPLLLKRGIDAGLVGDTRKKGDPALLWSVDDNGWVYEAQITNPGYAEYHAYPVLPVEAIARKVLTRYREYVDSMSEPGLTRSLALALERYK